jgi:hypothetical protein
LPRVAAEVRSIFAVIELDKVAAGVAHVNAFAALDFKRPFGDFHIVLFDFLQGFGEVIDVEQKRKNGTLA